MDRRPILDRPLAGIAVVAAGLAFAVLGWVNLLVFQPEYIGGPLDLGYELLVNGGLALLSAVVGARALGSRLSDDDVRHLASWYAGSVLFVWALVLWANLGAILSGTSPLAFRRLLLAYGGLAGLAGVVAGRNRAEARQNRRLLEERERQREQIVRQRDSIRFLNRLLRHDVANGLNLISGRAQILRSHDDDAVRDHAAVIADRADHLVDLSERVRTFSTALQDEPEPVDVEVAELVETQARSIQRAYPDALVSVSSPDEVCALADDFLSPAVANVIENAVEHNDTARPTVDVDVEPTDETVRITVRDDGPGIPDERKAALDDSPTATAGAAHGVGLSLVSTVVERYGGDLTVEDNVPRGTVVTLTLPRAPAS